ncbi:hypothetical protein C4D60_Mb04t11950 [Musa balbisiana]|uniref:adenylate kinase n=1 Tax=Musa balbisiana TaxID=52838 RepID=A0A4S8KBD5_MUSBA|nr:hypothetical protein C4D60_Mb04t11950 [Musa balbisiana]
MSDQMLLIVLIGLVPRSEAVDVNGSFSGDKKIIVVFVLEVEMERRLLSRNQGRVDDNIETIRKRFRVFVESSLPVVEYYELKGKVRKVDALKPIDEVFETVKAIFAPFHTKRHFRFNCLIAKAHPLGPEEVDFTKADTT